MICYEPIGIVNSPFKEINGMPIQPVGARGVAGQIEILPDLQGGLKDLDGFSHIFVIYHFHGASGYSLLVKPFLDQSRHGVFATRAPKRPNSIGLSVLKLLKVDGNILHVEHVDILDGTPVLDIKPYVPTFDAWETDKVGWFAAATGRAETERADDRFK
ncbi:tRNA (N6-threonylcarbamoyladenosine(37)-N6)-methyltransferase TrmO [Desulforhabdus sp. TSK]|uniref:tRNA (N6-threonylcarbamoyladenosine(37)-N6)-methyltransferase TrmO n=1 Tax=Desulforhabdus sp. TSK TaxID=2925014 RepID=UPI001FC8B7E2|nr:tRNA (N6-threonylcarbamoyladenosine(37)-N6)-methyltransferase TrmO [Desulforhabdus sp. TSK]GKT11004.1 tRNA (N6-threonylcarbamoyladenosine(37)-N6)-methyltransferase TrmO [Desulforhabdus sp. TSK]